MSTTPEPTPAVTTRRRLVPIGQAAPAIGYARCSLYRFAAEGRLRLVRIGDRTFVEEGELDRFVAAEAEAFVPGARPRGAAKRAKRADRAEAS